MQTETHTVRQTIIPAMDVFTKDGDLRLVLDVPGVTRDGLRLGVEQDVLSIEAQRADQPERGFRRQVRLPEGIDVDGIDAQLENGVLTITLPQSARARKRIIEVR